MKPTPHDLHVLYHRFMMSPMSGWHSMVMRWQMEDLEHILENLEKFDNENSSVKKHVLKAISIKKSALYRVLNGD